jgi:hypothetical protein
LAGVPTATTVSAEPSGSLSLASTTMSTGVPDGVNAVSATG